MNRLLVFILMLGSVWGTQAQNIDLATVPGRDSVQLTIYNSEDITLVRETRTLTFSEGLNTLQFSWANTLIDPTSVQINFLAGGEALTLIDTVYPHDRPQMLYWAIASEGDGEATVEISYFTSGISWAADYVVTATDDETAAEVRGFVTVSNHSGEDYPDAQVRVVVGRINLVERIERLARQGVRPPQTAAPEDLGRHRRNVAVRGAVQDFDAVTFGGAAEQAPHVVREGLSEYFIFTIQGQQTVPNQWSKRILSFTAEDSPLDVVYRFRPRQYGDQLVKMYRLTNDEASDMGESPLPNGVVRVFRNNGRGGLSYVIQQSIQYVAITDDIELNLGADPEVVFELDTLYAWRDNIWTRLGNAQVLRQVDGDGMRIENNARVVGWDDHVLYAQHIRNYSSQAIKVEVRRTFGGDTRFRSEFDAENYDVNTVAYETEVGSGELAALRYVVMTRQGSGSEDARVLVEPGDVPSAPWE